ncbi:hypothetical protein AB4457_08720 [Vibrio splendidus]
MNKTVLVLAVTGALITWSTHSIAAKPEWAGKGKPDLEEVKTLAEAKKVEGEIDDREKQLDSMIEEKNKKAEQERKEEGKGSEKGQQQREENSKKWWNFWE